MHFRFSSFLFARSVDVPDTINIIVIVKFKCRLTRPLCPSVCPFQCENASLPRHLRPHSDSNGIRRTTNAPIKRHCKMLHFTLHCLRSVESGKWMFWRMRHRNEPTFHCWSMIVFGGPHLFIANVVKYLHAQSTCSAPNAPSSFESSIAFHTDARWSDGWFYSF